MFPFDFFSKFIAKTINKITFFYSARKHLIQTLNDENIPAHQIVQISGHKNVNSLNNYSGINKDQSKQISKILSHSNQTAVAKQNLSPSATATTSMSDLPMGRGFFVNSSFHGNVTFNFHSSEMGLSQNNVFNQQVKSPTPTPDVLPDFPDQPSYKRIRMIPDSDSD